MYANSAYMPLCSHVTSHTRVEAIDQTSNWSLLDTCCSSLLERVWLVAASVVVVCHYQPC